MYPKINITNTKKTIELLDLMDSIIKVEII